MSDYFLSKTEVYLQAAKELNDKCNLSGGTPERWEFNRLLRILGKATREQYFVWERLWEETHKMGTPPKNARILFAHAFLMWDTWMSKSSSETPQEVFLVLNNSFHTLLDSNRLMRKQLNWSDELG